MSKVQSPANEEAGKRADIESEESDPGPPAGADIARTKWTRSSNKPSNEKSPQRPVNIESVPAKINGLDREGRPSLDAASEWRLSVFFSPASNVAFLKMRSAALQIKVPSGIQQRYLYIFIPPERIASLTIDPDSYTSMVYLRLVLKTHGDLIGPVETLCLATKADEDLLASAQWIATRPALAIEMTRSYVPLDRWHQLCQAITESLLRSDAGQADLLPLYKGRGGRVLNSQVDADTPPAYEDETGSSTDLAAAQPPRKRQRTSSMPFPEAMGKDFALYIQNMCNDIVARQRDEMIVPLLARIKQMEDSITDRVIEHVDCVLEERLVQLRNELNDDMEEGLDSRVDAAKDEIRDHVVEQVREQVEDQISIVEGDIVENVMARIEPC